MLHRTLHILHRNVIHFIRLAWGKAAIALLLLLSGGLIAAWAVPLPDRLDERDSTVVTWDDGEPAHVMLSEDDKLRMPVSLDRLDEDYVDALLGLEDERFYMHPGVDPIAIVRAAISNATNGRVVSGGSTITMQLVRLLEPRPRTLRSKVIEAFRAMQLEMHLSKEEILEAYLRFVPYGRNIEGVESAALAYYGETTEALSEGQIATLLAVPQAPGTRHPSEANAERLREGRRDIARTLYKEGLLFDRAEDPEFGVDEALRQVAAEPVPESFTSVPRELPHVASWLRASEPDRDRFVTTLDESTQETVEHLVAEREAEAARGAVDNVAVVLTEHETGAVRALVGNFDFSLKRSGGQIPAFDVARSTGSLLKPFVYADAIDGGKTTPRQRVPDVPKSFGHYTPHNFEYRYNGLVRMEDALAQSLNVPLVELLRRVGVDEFASTLRRLGLRRFNPKPGDQGLSMAVGGVEATPIEVTRLYAALANDGRPTPVSVLADQVDQERYRPVFGEGASWMARDALRRRDRPDFPGRGADLGPRAPIAWKTGTSQGHRDAWTAGTGDAYTAVVWMGNLTNRPSNHLVGSEAAAPLFFDILGAVDAPEEIDDPRPEEGMSDVEVCAFSGHLPTDACEHTETIEHPEHAVPTERCPYHVEVDVDQKTGHAVTGDCRRGRDVTTRSFVQLPGNVRRWMRDHLGAVSEPPAMHPDCGPSTDDTPPTISSPPAGETLVLMDGIPAERQKIPLEADAPSSTQTVHWFVDGRFIGEAPADDSIWWTPTRGDHEIVAMNDGGESTTRRLEVR